MTRQPSAPDSPDPVRRNASEAVSARPRLLDIERDRPKRIDQYIDYFGSGENGGRLPRIGFRAGPGKQA